MSELKGLATGIGSLPQEDVREALDLIFKYTPKIPFWPQLPKRDVREGMVAQFSEGLPCIKVVDKSILFNPENKEKELEKFYEHIIAEDLDYFRISEDFALGLHRFYQRLERSDLRQIEYIKCQVTGPFTTAASIKDENGVALLHDYDFMQVILKAVAMKAAWQIKFFKKFKKKIIVFIDEPYLGSFGSGYVPINREEVINYLAQSGEDFKDVVERYIKDLIKDLGLTDEDPVLLGVHCCGNTDWSLFTDVRTIDIISFDAYAFLDRLILYADNLKGFFEREGILCWGIVPTQEFTGKETADLLIRKIKDAVEVLVKKGLDKDLLLKNLLLSPSCGLGTLDPERSERIFGLLSEISNKLFDNLI